MEKTNIRYVTSEQIPEKIDFASVDVSFISLKKVLGPARELLQDDARMVCLIKPQFEAGREKVGKKGVVRDKAVHLEVIEMILQFVTSIHFEILNLDYSPIKGLRATLNTWFISESVQRIILWSVDGGSCRSG